MTSSAAPQREPVVRLPRRNLECSRCGYGAVSAEPPERCPMCQAEEAWIHAPWRPFGH